MFVNECEFVDLKEIKNMPNASVMRNNGNVNESLTVFILFSEGHLSLSL